MFVLINTNYANLSSKLVEEIIDKELEAMEKIDVGMATSDAREDNASRWLVVVRIVVVLGLMNFDDCFKCQQQNDDNVILSKRCPNL